MLILVIDQTSKAWVLANLGPGEATKRITVLGDWLSLIYIQNRGVAFGMFQNGAQIFIITSLVICAGAIYVYAFHLPNQSRWIQLSLGLIVGGAIGNVIDRIRFGHVVDFVSVGWWPVFNAADSAICVGVALMALYLLLNDQEARPSSTPRDDTLLTSLLTQESWPQDERRESK